MMAKGLSRSYVPPIAPEYQGAPSERRSVSNDWAGVGPFAGGSSPHSQAPPGGAGWQGARSSAAQLMGPQPSIFGPPLGGAGPQMAPPALGSGPLAAGSLGVGSLGGGIGTGPQQQPQQPQQQYARWP
uniref:Uncharacterized protein n=1 Tax=Alexandrium catenella TaxID=2925 RepID=A0A7S1WP31_ALECA